LASTSIAAVLLVSDAYGNRIDFLIGLRGLDAGVFRRAVRVPLQGRELRVAGVEDFIAMKVFAGGPQDLTDARRARAVAGDALDLALLRRLAAGYGPSAAATLEQLLRGD